MIGLTRVGDVLTIELQRSERRNALNSQLVEEIRDTIASELLTGGLSVQQVASRLGYSETASFTHAYTRWHGFPPSRHH